MRAKRMRDLKENSVSTVIDSLQEYEEHALRELRNAGYRITMPRVQVIRALADTKIALSAYAIHEKITSGGGKIDVVSVYRILTTLQEVGLIHHIGIVDGYYPSRMAEQGERRSEVVVDEDSGEVRELRLPREIVAIIEAQARAEGFEPNVIKLEIGGKLS